MSARLVLILGDTPAGAGKVDWFCPTRLVFAAVTSTVSGSSWVSTRCAIGYRWTLPAGPGALPRRRSGVALGPVVIGVGAVVVVGLGVGVGVTAYRRRRAAKRVRPIERVAPAAMTVSVAAVDVTPVGSVVYAALAEPAAKPETVEQVVERAALMAEIEEIVAVEARRARHRAR